MGNFETTDQGKELMVYLQEQMNGAPRTNTVFENDIQVLQEETGFSRDETIEKMIEVLFSFS